MAHYNGQVDQGHAYRETTTFSAAGLRQDEAKDELDDDTRFLFSSPAGERLRGVVFHSI